MDEHLPPILDDKISTTGKTRKLIQQVNRRRERAFRIKSAEQSNCSR